MIKKEREAQLLDEYIEGMAAKGLVNNQVWQNTIKELEATYIDAIRNDGGWFKFKDDREENCRRLQVLDDLVTTINNKLEQGEQARKRLEANDASK